MDDLLKRLGQAPPPAALSQIDDAIMAAWSAASTALAPSNLLDPL